MSYSRWAGRGSGHWYTYWKSQDRSIRENRNNAVFDIFEVTAFTAKQLRDNMDDCLKKVKEIDPKGDIEELRTYALKFLKDVDTRYPKKSKSQYFRKGTKR
jgi:hypothetical protein